MAEYAPEEPDALDDLVGEVEQAVDNPVDGPAFDDIVGEGTDLTIVTENEFRQAPAETITPYLVERAEDAGANVKVVIANGKAPAPHDDEGRAGVVGQAVVDNDDVPIDHNDVEAPEKYEFVDVTNAGIPLWVHQDVVNADSTIWIGTTQATLWGYGGSGGIIPGVSNNETIERNHITTLAPNCRPGNNDIKMQEDKYEALDRVGVDMGINCIVTNQKECAYVNAGEPVAAHKESIEVYDETYRYDVGVEDTNPDVVITGTTAPTDHLYFHSGWAVVNCEPLVKEGGTIIHASPSPGYGDWPGFALMDLMAEYSHDEDGQEAALKDLVTGEKELWAGCIWYPIMRTMLKADVNVVTEDYNVEDAQEAGLNASTSLEEAYEAAVEKHGEDLDVAVVPFGRYTVFS